MGLPGVNDALVVGLAEMILVGWSRKAPPPWCRLSG